MRLRIGRSAPPRRMMPMATIVMLLLLLAQFLFGMFVNLYVGIESHPGSSQPVISGAIVGVAWAITAGGPALALHTALGLLLTVGSFALLAMAIASGRSRALVTTTAVGLLGVLGAGLNGIGFLNYGVDKATYLMSVGFSVAVAGYVATLFFASQSAVRRVERVERQTAVG